MAAASEATTEKAMMLMEMFDDDNNYTYHAYTDDDDTDDETDDEIIIETIDRSINEGLFIAASLCQRKRKKPTRIRDYVERTVQEYCEVEFHQHFRMHRADFEVLCNWIGPLLPKERTISLEKKTLATLWFLGNQESFRGIGNRFNLSKGSLRRVIHLICRTLASHQKKWIKWPALAEMHENASQFQAAALHHLLGAGFPGVIGALDGTHVQITAPSQHRDSFVNRKKDISIQMQVICNKSLLFLDVCAGYPGSVHDARVFRKSSIFKYLQDNPLPPAFHLLGDSAYQLTNTVLVPFRDNGHLTDSEKKYNRAHSSTRVEIERAIGLLTPVGPRGLLKGKFRKLKFVDMQIVQHIPVIMVAACVLHNFIILNRGIDEDEIITVDDVYNYQDEGEDRPASSGIRKRLEIARALP
ncbi:putative nuclease HARBI1 [Pomacea canaliculata]|uniref:putative nuclease HARBI1 n=1 Tax=Pomacea canaliculata TaxID=400727 RepID=UPI000D73B892|nr:putative nuclease HARBI1 [Pomacea canaliculata]